ncbi:MAG: hypothetical protein JXR70_09600 [Spirochaetales bacterium]|nr:hypothetical protein [Spirochaetales bacterium]
MKILFLSALESEAREFKKQYSFHLVDEQKRAALYLFRAKRGETPDEYYWGITGVGPKSCRRFIKFISSQALDFDLVILTGYCGALNQNSQPGEVLISRKIHLWSEAKAIDLDIPAHSKAGANIFSSCTVTILADEEFKMKILRTHPKAGFVDMESYYLAEFFQQYSLRLWLVRAVTDGPGFRFPDFAFIQDSLATLVRKGLLWPLFLRPSNWGATLALIRNINKAGKGLFRFFSPLIQNGFQDYL